MAVASLALMFILGFFIAYNISNMQQYMLENKDEPRTPVIGAATKALGIEETVKAKAKVVAVSPKNEGVIGEVNVEITPGDGKVLVNTNPFVEPDTQHSAVTAVNIAKDITNTDLSKKNVLIDFDISGTVLGGPSAGAAMTLAMISAMENKPIKRGIAVTGTIEPDGTIGMVGGLVEKGDVAADNNYKLFLVPKGGSTYTYYERELVKRDVGGFVFYRTRVTPKTVDLKEYFKERGMDVVEVDNIRELMDYML